MNNTIVISGTWINNYIPHIILGCNHLSMSYMSSRVTWLLRLMTRAGGYSANFLHSFPHFSVLPKHFSYWISHLYLMGDPQHLSCGDTCQIWMWFKESNRYFCQIWNFAYGESNEQSFSNPTPESYKIVLMLRLQYSKRIRMMWLLMPWLLMLPGHHQQWSWLYGKIRFLFPWGRIRYYICVMSMCINVTKCRYIFAP